MTNKISTNKKGFTIIEVVLVLAIAGLIFLMVFVALPALQRSQRDTQRRNDMSRLATAITNWQANHTNSLPASSNTAELLNSYLKQSDGEFKDPSGNNYTIAISSLTDGATKDPSANPQIDIVTNAFCDGGKAKGGGGAGKYAILYKLEGAGTYCQDNS